MKRSVLIAVVILAGIAAWVVSGQIGPRDAQPEPSAIGSRRRRTGS